MTRVDAMGVVGIATLVFDNVCGVIIVRITSCARGDTICLRHCKLTISAVIRQVAPLRGILAI